MNLGNKLAVGEVVDHGTDEVPAVPTPEPAPEAVTVRAEAPPEPVVALAD